MSPLWPKSKLRFLYASPGCPGIGRSRYKRLLPRPPIQCKTEIRNLWDPCELLRMEKALGVEEQLHTQGMHITASSAYKCK